MTHTYIKPSSNQRSTTARVASAAGRLRSSRLSGNWLPAHSHLPKMPFFGTCVWFVRGPANLSTKTNAQPGNNWFDQLESASRNSPVKNASRD